MPNAHSVDTCTVPNLLTWLSRCCNCKSQEKKKKKKKKPIFFFSIFPYLLDYLLCLCLASWSQSRHSIQTTSVTLSYLIVNGPIILCPSFPVSVILFVAKGRIQLSALVLESTTSRCVLCLHCS
ncbi:hypothetical protein F4811DRAFT_411722 [Daldinia bambusicola]|nr:hypothetical protein F4811DRAFT_411722 [Daldinia bambusicola]